MMALRYSSRKDNRHRGAIEDEENGSFQAQVFNERDIDPQKKKEKGYGILLGYLGMLHTYAA